MRRLRVRKTGLVPGLVDYKICAIDAIWSGMKFTHRRPVPARGPGKKP